MKSFGPVSAFIPLLLLMLAVAPPRPLPAVLNVLRYYHEIPGTAEASPDLQRHGNVGESVRRPHGL